MMPDIIANAVFQVEGKEYRPGDLVPLQIPDLENLMKKGFVVWNGGEQAAREAAKKEAAEQAAREAAEKEAAEQAALEAAEVKEKPVRGRKAKVAE